MAEINYCEWLTGFPIKFYNFIASFETNGAAAEFYSDAPVEVDWGSGKWLKYEKGVVHGFQENTGKSNPVVVRSSEPVTEFRFGSSINYDNSFIECNIHKAFDLETANKLCYRLEIMERFSFFGTNKVTDFTSAWEDCTELVVFEGLDTTEAITFKQAWKNCNKLVNFPSVYSRKCLTVEEAWMGCTAMVSFPIIGVENCRNFNGAWRGNTQLADFPLIDVSSGVTFNHSWAYCVNLLDFPVLRYDNAESMNHTFAYNYKIRTLGAFNTGKVKDFTGTFERNLALECITEINTKGIDVDAEGNLLSEDMFLDDCLLVRPDETEQASLMVGSYYKNPEPCYFDAGRSKFYAVAKTTAIDGINICNSGASYICTFTVTGNFDKPGKADFEVDWGDGIFLPYNEGTVTGIPIHTGIIHIRSEEDVHKITFDSDTYMDISIKRGKTLTTCEGMAKDKSMLLNFSIYGPMIATNYDDMLANDIHLINIGEIDYSSALTMNRTYLNCRSLLTLNMNGVVVDLAECTSFISTFEGCHSITYVPTLDTVSGLVFDNMFKDCTAMTCMYGINTINQTSTVGMFDGDVSLYRPNINEIPYILSGQSQPYSNGGNCGSPFDMRFTSNGDVSFTVDVEVQVDMGDGHFDAMGPGLISFAPMGEFCFVYGPVGVISFDTDTFTSVSFYNTDYITSMDNMFRDKLNLTSFDSFGTSSVVSWDGAFSDCVNLVEFSCKSFSRAESFVGMFSGCTSLFSVDYMNTLVGKDFDFMFADCPLLKLNEINTTMGEFDKFYITCDPTSFDCDTDIVNCTPGEDEFPCTEFYNCDPDTGDEFPCFAESTMFLNWELDTVKVRTPGQSDRLAISSQAHWKDGKLI